MKPKSSLMQCVRILVLGILLALLLEATVFNSAYFITMRYSGAYDVDILYQGLEKLGNGYYLVTEEEAYIEMTFPYQDIDNIHIDVQQDKRNGKYTDGVRVTPYLADEGNQFYYGLPNRLVTHDIQTSQYLNLHSAGKVCQVKILIDSSTKGSNIIVHDVSLNTPVPFVFSWIRVFSVGLLISTVYILIPKNGFYASKFDPKSTRQTVIIVLVALCQFVFLAFLITQLDYSTEPESSPYVFLANALAKGQTHVDLQPTPELLALDNPYDTDLRWATNVSFYWDYAFYNERYYVYFGIVPALLFYLPYYLLTGSSFPLKLDFYVCGALLIVGVFLLMRKIIDRYFKSIPFILYLLIVISMINGMGILYLFLHPNFYSEPIMMAVMFLIWGLYFWVSSAQKSTGELSPWRLAAGSLCIAVIAGCRPQMLMAGIFALPLFLNYFLHPKTKKAGKYIVNVLCFVTPILAVAAGIMYYNYIRFGSAVDFGANYNLTSNDMTKRGLVLGRSGFGVFTYLLQPPNIIARFPYITKSLLITEYMGRTISEDMYGGLLINNIVLFLGFMFVKVKHELKEKRLYGLIVLSLVSGFIIVIADSQLAGILTRYYADFAFFFFFAAILVIFMLLEKVFDKKWQNYVYGFIACLCIASLLYNVLFVFNNSNINEHYMLHQKVLNLIQFWRS